MPQYNLYTKVEAPTLSLPRRFERLVAKAAEEGVKVETIVERVPTAAARVDELLRQAQAGGVGRFEVFLGLSGSGKTTFFKTLPKFFGGVAVIDVPASTPLEGITSYLRKQERQSRGLIAVLFDRDNPKLSDDEMSRFFESLRVFFREPQGNVVIVWPITDETVAHQLAQTAWAIGRDSVVDSEEAAVFSFSGLPKDRYYEVADVTSKTLNSGKGLEVFGLTRDNTKSIVMSSETLGQFYGKLESQSAKNAGSIMSVLEAKELPAIWILLAGDNNPDVDLTVATLTQGTRQFLDIDRVAELLDNPTADTLYLKEWKQRRNTMAYLMRLLDVRLFGLPPNVALHAYRAFGDAKYKDALKSKTTSLSQAMDALRATRFYRAIIGDSSPAKSVRQPTAEETANEYIRLQRCVGRDTPALNKALAKLIEETLASDGVKATVTAEQACLSGLPNKPDIHIALPSASICLEPTWRTTGAEVKDELNGQQNTLSVGHIQKYVLEKVLEFVKGLSL